MATTPKITTIPQAWGKKLAGRVWMTLGDQGCPLMSIPPEKQASVTAYEYDDPEAKNHYQKTVYLLILNFPTGQPVCIAFYEKAKRDAAEKAVQECIPIE